MKEDITIDKEFAKLLPAMTPEEKLGLETNLITEGCRDPLVVWNTKDGRILVDGHNRYSICHKNRISFEVVEKFFKTREEVVNWMIDNQLGKRNIIPEARTYLLGRKYNTEKMTHGGDRKSNRSRDGLKKTGSEIADQYGLSERTVERAGKFAASVDTIGEKVGEEAKQKILSGQSKVNQKDLPALARKAEKNPADVKAAIDGEKAVSRVLDKPKPARLPKPKPPADPSDVISQGQARAEIWRVGARVIVSLKGGSLREAESIIYKMVNKPGSSLELLAGAVAIMASKFPSDPVAYMTETYNRLREIANGKSTNASGDRRADTSQADASAREALDAARSGGKTRRLGTS